MALNVLLGLCGLAAVAVLLLLHGFNTPPWPTQDVQFQVTWHRFLFPPHDALLLAEYAIAAWLVLDRVLRLALASRREDYLRSNWIDYAMVVITGFAMPFAQRRFGAAGALTHIGQARAIVVGDAREATGVIGVGVAHDHRAQA